jgi:hypothetical protein
MQRNPTIDVLRGVLLLLMTMTHLPTVWSSTLGQPLGFISAAEGFVFLSACLAGKIFIAQQEQKGLLAASRWIFGRALRLYLFHLALLLLTFTVIAWIASTYERPAVRNLLAFYFQSPQRAMLGSALLAYQPPLLDILPMYVLFFLGTPAVMSAASRFGWGGVLAVSVGAWAAAQFGLRTAMYAMLERFVGWDIPVPATGAFDLLAWQLLWVLGLWFGAAGFGRTRQVLASGGGVLNVALAISCGLLLWRHVGGPRGFTDAARYFFWIDKWTLSPVRVVNLAALVCVCIGFGSDLMRRVRVPALEMLGRASQWVFVVHIAVALFVLCLIGQDDQPLGGTNGLLVMGVGYLSLFLTADIYRRVRAWRTGPAPA